MVAYDGANHALPSHALIRVLALWPSGANVS
jgi:hypothetical protein